MHTVQEKKSFLVHERVERNMGAYAKSSKLPTHSLKIWQAK